MAQSNVAAEVHRLQAPLHNGGVAKANTPHFMSPTIASKLSQVSPPDSRPTTPVSIKSVKSDGGQSLLQSAVQRVSRRRAATNEMTREHSRSPVKHSKVVSFPDKVYEYTSNLMKKLTEQAVDAYMCTCLEPSSHDLKC